MDRKVSGPTILRKGLSLIEVVVSTVIVAFIVSASMQTVATAVLTRTRTAELQLGPSLARGLMCEILQTPYTDPEGFGGAIGLDPGEGSTNRLSFDDVDDFHGWSSVSPVHPDGTGMPIGAGWQRQVTVEFLDPSTFTVTATDMGLKRIGVTVTSPGGKVTAVETLRSRLGANERPPAADRVIVAGVTVAIELESGIAAESSATFSKNHALDD
ncbi:MAG: hypothetical protein Aurels2KO_55020 [Aureliella sp.]